MHDKKTFHITTIEIGVDADFTRSYTTEAETHEDALQHYIDKLNDRPLKDPWKRSDFTQLALEDEALQTYKNATLYDASDVNTSLYIVITEASARVHI